VYGLRDGLVRDLLTAVTRGEDAPARYRSALAEL